MSRRTPSYDELFSRNIGVFTPAEQARISRLRVAIAGAGGLGAPVAHLLARLGVGEVRLADPEVFEPSNVNRQWGAYLDTLGHNKADATGAELLRINPGLRLAVHANGLTDSTVDEFVDGADAVVDALEFLETGLELRLHTAARERGLWVFVAQGLLEMNTGFAVDPRGISLAKQFELMPGHSLLERAFNACFPLLPYGVSMGDIRTAIAAGTISVSSWCVPPVLDAAMVVSDIVRTLVQGGRPLAVFPDVRVQDTRDFSVQVIRRDAEDFQSGSRGPSGQGLPRD